MKKIIYGFKNKEQLYYTIDKIKEYEGCKFVHNPGDDLFSRHKDIYLVCRIDTGRLTIGNNFNEFDTDYWSNDILISVDNYLNPIKIGDIVEVVDDSEYNGNRFKVVDYCEATDTYKLKIDGIHIWRTEDRLQVINRDTENLVISDVTDTLLSDTGATYGASNTASTEYVDEQILNLKKELMNKTYNDYRIEDFMSDKKNRARIDNAMEALKEMYSILDKARHDIQGVSYVIDSDITKLENGIRDMNIDTIESVLDELKQTKEYISNYINNSVGELGTITKEERTIEDKFKR